MPTPPSDLIAARLSRLQEDIRADGLDALLITNLVNLRYLTRFNGTAGAAVITPHACRLLIDFRYLALAREATADTAIEIALVDASYDEADVRILSHRVVHNGKCAEAEDGESR